MNSLKNVICIFLLLFVFPSDTLAQYQGIRTFSLEEENRTVGINVLYKDRSGYIMAGTDKGIYKFDGIRFYRINFNNKDFTDTVTAIIEDAEKKIWIGFRNGRLAHIINNTVVYFNPEEGTPAQSVTSFVTDKQGRVWFGTNGEGVYYYKKNRLFLIDKANGLSDLNISSLALMDDGSVLAGTDQGLNIISFINEKASVKVLGPKQGLPDYIVTSIFKADKRRFYIGMQDKGICIYNHEIGKISRIPSESSWAYGQVNAIHGTGNNLLVSTESSGLISVRTDNFQAVRLPVAVQRTGSNITDDMGNHWIAAGEKLIRVPGNSISIYPLPDGTVFEHIHALLADNKGNLWVTNDKNELIKNDPVKQISEKITLSGVNDKTDITSLYQDIYDNIWIGTMGSGLYILDPRTNAYRSVNENPGFINSSILSVTGKGNSVFISSLEGSMHVLLTGINRNISSAYNYTDFDKDGAGSNYIYTIYRDSKNRTWFGTDGNGITMLENGKFTRYDPDESVKDDRIFSITEDLQGNMWFSTGNAGIYKFDGKTFSNYSTAQGLSDLYISSVKTNRWGNIIIIHKKGIDVLDPITGHVYYINENLGISGLNVEDLGAVSQDRNSSIYISSETGIVRYSHEEKQIYRPRTVLENIQLYFKPLADTSDHIFEHEDNSFTFSYTGLYYTDPEAVYYQYKLEGLDTNWIITKDRSQTFSQLAPGKYTFRIRSSLNRNFVDADMQSWSFTIRQAFYKQWWFLLLVALFISGFIYLYIRNRERSLKKLQQLHQEKITSRFEVLRNQVNPHFLFNSFNTLISTIEDDPKLAVEYAEQLSDFFRHIVNYRDKDVISLNEELEVLTTYYFLQKKRYGDNLIMKISVTESEKREYRIPPLTLQLLIENAIKHNIITRESPLEISLEIVDKAYLIVKNNINLRISKEAGAGMGLQNIMNRYTILTNKNVLISNHNGYFIVSLPLIPAYA